MPAHDNAGRKRLAEYLIRHPFSLQKITSPVPERLIPPPKAARVPEPQPPAEILLIPAPPKQSARDMRPLWRDLILKIWGGDPLQCPCCKGTMKPVRKVIRREEIEKRRRLVGVLDRNPPRG